MLSTIKVVNYGGSNGITFYVSVDTNRFDYQLMGLTLVGIVHELCARYSNSLNCGVFFIWQYNF